MNTHPSEFQLYRLRAGESAQEIREHVTGCGLCQATLGSLDAKQREFERLMPFERFAAGVEAAVERVSKTPRRRRWTARLGSLAAVGLCVMGAQFALSRLEPDDRHHRRKGEPLIEVIVAGVRAQRAASVDPSIPESLAPGERIRLRSMPSRWSYLLVVSINDQGHITPMYLENGRSLALSKSNGTQWLDVSFERTGPGLERLVGVFSESPLTIDEVSRSLTRAYHDARGDLTQLSKLTLPGEQFHRTFQNL
jgi:hypothetical protein